MKRFRPHIHIVLVCLLAMIIAPISCIHEERFENDQLESSLIQYNPDNYDITLTKSSNSHTNRNNERIFLGMLDNDSLFVKIQETDIVGGVKTKGTPVPTTPSFFFLTAYRLYNDDNKNKTEKYINELRLDADTEQGWSNYSPKTYWPYDYNKVHFFAHNIENRNIAPTYSLDDFSAEFEFSTPKDSENGDATAQSDIIFAIKHSIERAEPQGTVDLNFIHVLSAVQFQLGELGNGDASGVAQLHVGLSGIISQGTCKIESHENVLSVGWDQENTENTENTDSFSQLISDNETFMLIPQTLTKASATVDIRIAGKSHLYSFPLTGEWLPNKMYTYTIISGGYVESTVGTIDDNQNQNTYTFPTIQNTGWTNSYIRVAIVGYWSKMDNIKIDGVSKPVEHIVATWDINKEDDTNASQSFNIGPKENQWTKGDDGFYYYNSVLTPGTEATPLFSTFTQNSTGSIEGSTLKLNIAVQAVEQADGEAMWQETLHRNN